MPSIIFNSYLDDAMRGLIVHSGVTYKVMLTTSSYTEDKDTHLVRTSPFANEVTGGGLTGYTATGANSTVTINKDLANDRIIISLGGSTWTTSAGGTLTARKAVWYVNVGSRCHR